MFKSSMKTNLPPGRRAERALLLLVQLAINDVLALVRRCLGREGEAIVLYLSELKPCRSMPWMEAIFAVPAEPRDKC